MSNQKDACEIVPFPKIRRLMVDGGRLGRQKHLVHGLVEVDVTCPRQMIRSHKALTGETLSFTGFIIACLAHAVDLNRHMQAYRIWGDKLVIFDDVDVNTMFEVEVDGRKIIRPHIIRAANRRSFREIHAEIRAFQSHHEGGRESSFIDRFVLLPAVIRRMVLGAVLKTPRLLKEMNGTVSMTAVGMFGSGIGWALPVSNHTLQITLGGISEKPLLIDGHLENREVLCLTVTLDHDIIDGAPAARFIQRLKELIESGYGLTPPSS